METYKFKTNVNCGGCIATIIPLLNQISGISNWEVDTADPSKILTIDASNVKPTEIIDVLNDAGFNAELL